MDFNVFLLTLCLNLNNITLLCGTHISVLCLQISRALILNKASDFIKEMKIKNQQHEVTVIMCNCN